MKKLIPLFLLAPLCGCAQVASGINQVNGALTSPAANQAVANLKAGAQAIVCSIANISAVATQINADVKAGSAVIKDTQTVYVVSSDVCKALGGTVTGTAVVQ